MDSSGRIVAGSESLRRVRHGLIAAVTVTASTGGVIYLVADPDTAVVVWTISVGVLLGTMVVGILCCRPRYPWAWLTIWAGLTLAFVGGTLVAFPHLAPFEVSPPSPADIMRLANYPLGAIGALVLATRLGRPAGWRSLLDAVVITGAGALAIWVLVFDPLLSEPHHGAAFWTALAYPVMDLGLLAVLVVVAMRLDGRAGPLWLVAAGLLGNLAADVAHAALVARDAYDPGGFVDLGWLLCFAALAAAPMVAIQPPGPAPASDPADRRRWRLAMVTIGVLAAPSLIAGQVAAGSLPHSVVAAASIVIVSVALVRMAVYSHDLESGRLKAEDLASALTARNAELAQTRADQRHLLDRVHRLVEEERARIAADIHDRPLQNLVGVSYQLERLAQSARTGDLDAVSRLADTAANDLAAQLTELRDLMTEIRPPVLDQRGLYGALVDRAAAIEAKTPTLRLRVEGTDLQLHPDVETALYRIAQESLQNVLRHADATTIGISLEDAGRVVRLRIDDDGRGFDASDLGDLVRTGHFGLAGMRERTEMLGGTMHIDTGDNGTSILFEVPPTPAPPTPLGPQLETVG